MSSPGFFVDISQVDGHAVVRFVGELDLASVDHAKTQAVRALEVYPRGPLLLDLSELSFCDSSGLCALYEIQQQAALAGREMALQRPHRFVRRVLVVAGMENMFAIDDSR
jgi:anti-sigma B factor antagonist